MTAPAPPAGSVRPVGVAGGVGGIEARGDDLGRLADRLARTGLALGGVVLDADLVGLALLDPGPAALDPVGAAESAAAIVRAVHGGAGVAAIATRTLTLAASVRAAAAAYAAADAAATSALVTFARGLFALPGAVAVGVAGVLRTGHLGTAVQDALGSDPHLVDAAALTVGAGDPAGAVGVLATLFPDGRAVLAAPVGSVGLDPAGPPRDVAGLVGALAVRNEDSPGAIDVRVLTTVDADGTVHRRAVVDVPGTKDWSLDPVNPDVTGLGSNLRALSGAASTYADGVLAALAAAGVGTDVEVLFVGHSLGGMVAVAAAGRAQAMGYRVGGVVTAGSPLGAIAPPAGVPVLALENGRDVVPHLDGATNPDGADVTTVTVDHPYATVGDNHGLDTAYLPGAADVDASTDPSVVAARDRLAPFITADTVETHVYVVSRAYP